MPPREPLRCGPQRASPPPKVVQHGLPRFGNHLAGLRDVPAAALTLMKACSAQLVRSANRGKVNMKGMGVYGNDYIKRTVVTLVELAANQPEDDMYPLLLTDLDGKPLVGEGRYVLHFEKAALPPADAFWPVTMYDGEGCGSPAP